MSSLRQLVRERRAGSTARRQAQSVPEVTLEIPALSSAADGQLRLAAPVVSPASVIALQRTSGNQAVGQLIGSRSAPALLQRDWDPTKCPNGVPAGVTAGQVIAQLNAGNYTFHGIEGRSHPYSSSQRWVYTFYMGFTVPVTDTNMRAWTISIAAHAHVVGKWNHAHTLRTSYPPYEIVPGSMYIPGFKDWQGNTSGAILTAHVPAYAPGTHGAPSTSGVEWNVGTLATFYANRYPY